MTAREERGLQIAATTKLRRKGKTWLVPSQSGRGQYQVELNKDCPHCTCPDHQQRGEKCKHIYAVEFTIRREFHPDGTTTVTETVKVTYGQDWPAYNMAQTNEKAEFVSLLHDLCQGIQEPEQLRGRKRLPLKDMLFSATFKVYSTFSGRRFATDLKEAHAKGLLSKLPCYNSLFVYFEKPELTPLLRELIVESSLPLKSVETDFAVDASGFSVSKKINWYDERYRWKDTEVHDWIKAHLMVGVKTNIVTAVEIGERYTHDNVFLPHLLDTTARNFQMAAVMADKGYSSKKGLELIANKGAMPYVIFKSNTVSKGDGSLWDRMYHYYAFNREEFMSFYHKRSNIESTFSMIKAKFGGYVRSKTPTAQMNEVLCKVLAHNLCCLIQSMHELGIEPEFLGRPSSS